MDFTEKTISTEKIFKGRILDVQVDTVTLPNGKEAKREIIVHSGGVSVLALDDDMNVFLVRQFRKPTESTVLEIPAGKLEYGEEPLEAAMRELEEEIGVKARTVIPMGYFYPTPAYCMEKTYMFFAKDLLPTNQHLDEDEFLEVIKMPYDELYKMVLNDEIIDGKTALATLKAKQYIK